MVGLESVDNEALGIQESSSMVGSEQSPLSEMDGGVIVLVLPSMACHLMSSVRLDTP